MGVEMLNSVQMGAEATAKTLVPATLIFAGATVARHRVYPVVVRPTERRGMMVEDFQSQRVGRRAEIHLEGYASFDDLNLLNEMTIRTVSASGDAGTPIAYTRNYVPTLTAPDTIKTYSIESGDDTQYYAYNGVFGTSLEISGARDEMLMFSWDGMGANGVAQAKTAALTQRTPEIIPANNCILYLDDSGGTLGTTAYAGCLISFRYRRSGMAPFKCLDGTLDYTRTVQPAIKSSIEFTALFDATSKALFISQYQAQTKQLVRIQVSGTQIHGGTVVNRRLRIDMAGFITNCTPIGGAQDTGQNTLTMTLESAYDTTAAVVDRIETISSVLSLATMV